MKRMTKDKIYAKLRHLLVLLTCLLLLLTVAVRRDGKALGHDFSKPETTDTATAVQRLTPDTLLVLTAKAAKDVVGYNGATPLKIFIAQGRIVRIEAEPNDETPEFFDALISDGLLEAWDGRTVDEALALQVDAVSGATYSSEAVKANVRHGLQAVKAAQQTAEGAEADDTLALSLKTVAALLVVLCAALLPLFVRSPRYRLVQLLLNVVVLGLWTGTFLSYAQLITLMSQGLSLPAALLPALMLITAFVYPLLGKKNHYCNWVCPLGAAQELAGKATKRKWRLGTGLNRWLTRLSQAVWAALMLLMCAGLGFEWLDYELFSAFLIDKAAPAVLIGTGVVLVLSAFVPRPYCRFVCPTGRLFKTAQNIK